MSGPGLRDTPYKGLMPYDEEDAPFFFGREREQEVIISNLMGSRLTLLYGPSGVGKSSVLRAGVVPRMRELARDESALHGKPRMAVVVFSQWSANPLAGLRAEVRRSVEGALGLQPLCVLPDASLTDELMLWAECVDGRLYIILDQFEEYFLYPQGKGPGSFAEEFTRAVNLPELRANFLLSLREDWYAKLDQFKTDIPKLYDNNLRVDLLNRRAARQAVVRPVTRYNRWREEGQPYVSIKTDFATEVLDQLARLADRNLLSEAAGHGSASGDGAGAGRRRIQTPYLQLVMTRLWHEAVKENPEHPVLHPKMLEPRAAGAAGKDRAEEIIQSHLDEVMSGLRESERRLAAEVFYQLVTPTGSKVAQKLRDLAGYAGVAEADIKPVLDKLTEKERGILTQVAPAPGQPNLPRYEIYHDVLGPAVLAWTNNYFAEREKEEAARRAAAEAAEHERLATQKLKLEQARALARKEAERAEEAIRRAEEERLRAEAERAHAEEQRRRVEAVSALAEAERARAEEQRLRFESEQQRRRDRERLTKRLQWVMAGLALFLALSVLASVVAVTQQRKADEARRRAEGAEAAARLAEGDAREQAELARESEKRATDEKERAQVARDKAELASKEAEKQMQLARQAAVREAEQKQQALAALAEADKQRALAIQQQQIAEEQQALAEQQSRRALVAQAIREAQGDTDFAFSPDGKLFVEIGEERALVREVNTGRVISSLVAFGLELETSPEEALDSSFTSVEFSPDGRSVVTSYGRYAIVWDVVTGKKLSLLSSDTSVNDAAFSPDSRSIASVSFDGKTRIWDAATGQLIRLIPDEKEVLSVAFSPDGKFLVTTNTDNIARILDVESGARVATLSGRRISGAAFTFDGRTIITVGRKTPLSGLDPRVAIWDARTGKCLSCGEEN